MNLTVKTALIILFGTALICAAFISSGAANIIIPVIISVLAAALMFTGIFFMAIRPLGSLRDSAEALSRGDTAEIPGGKKSGGDEIGLIKNYIARTADYLNRAADTAEKLGGGCVPEGFAAASKADRLGAGFEKLTAYMDKIRKLANELADGNFAVNFAVKSENDATGAAFAAMIKNLRPLIGNIKLQTETLLSSSRIFVGIAAQLKSTAGQLSETMSHISGATAQSAGDSQDAAKSALNANQASKKGMELMAKMLSSMSFIRTDMETSVKHVTELAVYSDRINQMLDVIRAVSEETKLLSFNAAIEAARAGEQGRGFAIVAEEIRKLSDNSAEELKKISVIIRDIRTHMSTLVDNINRESAQIKEGAEILEQSSAMFSEIAGAVDMATSKVESIASSSEEIAASAQQSAASSQEQTASVEEFSAEGLKLESAAKILKETAEKFRV